MTDWQLIFRPVGGHWVWGGLLLCLLLSVALFASSLRATARRRQVILALRVLACLLVALIFARPDLIFTKREKQTPSLLLLADTSRSMLVPDAVGGRTRWQELQRVLQSAQPKLEQLKDRYQVKVYQFAEELKAASLEELLPPGRLPEGRLTSLGNALQDALASEAGKPIVAVLILSDGAARVLPPRDLFPPVAARLFADANVPILPIRFGEARSAEQVRDVSLADLAVPPSVFVKNKFSVTVTAKLTGYSSQELPVELWMEQPDASMKLVQTVVAKPEAGEVRQALTLQHIPEVAGEYKLMVKAPGQPGELITNNNQLSTFITVKPGGLNVLYVEAAVRPEARFLRAALDASPDIRLEFQRVDPRAKVEAVKPRPEWFKPGAFDVYLLGDVPASCFAAEDLKELNLRVNSGAGLGMLGGWYSFGPGGYADTPLEGALPVELNRLERQPLGEKPTPDLHLPGPLLMLPNSQMALPHYLMRLTSGPTLQATWQRLPPLLGANKFQAVKKAALVLAEGPGREPLLAVGEFGGGRTFAFAGDSTYQWVMHGHGDLHRRFWRQVILWLARQDQKQSGSVWLELESRRYRPGSQVNFTAGALSAAGTPVIDGSLSAEIILPDNTVKPLVISQDRDQGIWSGSFVETLLPGDYRVRIRGVGASAELGAAEGRFLVYDQDLELDNPAADPGVLGTLATITQEAGGKLITPEELPRVLDELAAQPERFTLETRQKISLWGHSALFWPLAVLLCIEWYLRKRWGLV